MPLPICYLDGEYLPLAQARISPLDRGFLFADSVYEVLPVYAGRMFRFREHFDRLARSLDAIQLASPHTHEQWLAILEALVLRNTTGEPHGADMYLYLQVTRGSEYGRNHAFPAKVNPLVFAMASQLPVNTPEMLARGLSAITIEEFRWGRCDIKSTALLANVLMKQRASEANANEAIIVRDGEVMEGASTSLFIVRDGKIATPPNSRRVLPGVTRDVAVELIAELALPLAVRPMMLDELRNADEVWMAASTRAVLPITRIDGQAVGSGRPGPMWARLNDAFMRLQARLASTPAL